MEMLPHRIIAVDDNVFVQLLMINIVSHLKALIKVMLYFRGQGYGSTLPMDQYFTYLILLIQYAYHKK